MNVIEWALSVKPDLMQMQSTHGIPALWAAAQMCHESAVNGGDGLSALALDAHPYAGLKCAEWEREYGCEPVTYGTWEVLDRTRVDLADAFCKAPSWEVWLQVYAGLLTGSWYKPALNFAADPMLYGLHIWQKGWATDPAYLVGVGGWMSRLLPDYADTQPAAGGTAAAHACAAGGSDLRRPGAQAGRWPARGGVHRGPSPPVAGGPATGRSASGTAPIQGRRLTWTT